MSETLDAYAARMIRASGRLERDLLGEVRDVAADMAERARRLARERMRSSGRGLEAITSSASTSGGTIEARVFGDTRRTPWLRVQEEGGDIIARTARGMLIPRADGTFRRAQRITLRPQRFIADAVAQGRPDLRTRVRARLLRTVGSSDGV